MKKKMKEKINDSSFKKKLSCSRCGTRAVYLLASMWFFFKKKKKKMSSSTAKPTTTSVINVKVEHLRPRYQNLQQWIDADPENHVYIGRPGVVFVDGKRFPPPTLASSKLFGNPFKIANESSRQKVISSYRRYAMERIEVDAEFRRAVFGLRGRTLGCWCKPLGCHGDVLKEIAESMTEEHLVESDAEKAGKIRERDPQDKNSKSNHKKNDTTSEEFE